MIRVSQIKMAIDDPPEKVKALVLKRLKIGEHQLLDYKIYKKSVDARRQKSLEFVYTVDVSVTNEAQILKRKLPGVAKAPALTYQMPKAADIKPTHPPVVIGFGPAGMLAALLLAQLGYNPIVLERGEAVSERVKSVATYWQTGVLNPSSNVQFGEGGAGTFSDGKLTTRVKDLRGRKVLEELVLAGAPEAILYEAHPHVGTDLLRDVVKNIRQKIISLGGMIRFKTTVTDFLIDAGAIKGVQLANGETIETNHVILAIGHSARDTFCKLYERGVAMRAKPFAVGVRIEHPQELINQAQYKEFADHEKLGAASYRLTYQATNGRGVYTFCMCPGGRVIPSSSENERLVTNGMSEHARSETNANSAVLVQVFLEDFGCEHPLAGIQFQQHLEAKAFALGGGNGQAPASLVGDFLKGQASTKLGSVKPSYALGVRLVNLNHLLPSYVTAAMKEGILAFDHQLKGFALNDAVLTGVESRSSSPVTILRDSETLQSTTIKGLYPSGEGAGYAGGIISAGIDGLKCAEQLVLQAGKT